jgi:hypothetical protein
MSRVTRSVLTACGVFALTFAAAYALSQWGREQGWLGAPAPASTGALLISASALVPPPSRPVASINNVKPLAWQKASVIVAGQRHALDGASVSLPSGTQFQIELLGLPAGSVQVHAISPDGHSTGTPLWSQTVGANGTALSPQLRLAGRQGLETLEIIHRGDGGISRRRVALWHL